MDEWGSLFSWGSDEFGQLGHNLVDNEDGCVRRPRLVKAMATLKECLTLVLVALLFKLDVIFPLNVLLLVKTEARIIFISIPKWIKF